MKNQKSLLVVIAALIINLGCGVVLWMLWSLTGPEFLENLMINLDWGVTAAFAHDAPQDIKRNFHVKPDGTLTIDSEIGTINVQTVDKNEVEVVLTREVEGKLDSVAQKALTDFDVTFEQNDSDIRIEGKFKRDRQYWMKNGHPLRFHFQVTVPYQSNVDLKTASIGAIHVDNLDGTVRVEASIGNLRLGEIQDAVWGKTGGPGSITLKGCQGDVNLESGVGNIELGSIVGKAIAKTGGPGKIVLKKCQSDVDLESGVGNIELGSVTGKEVIAKTGGPGKIIVKKGQSKVDVKSGVGNIELVSVAGKVIAKTGGPGKIVLKECQSGVGVESGVGNIYAEIPTQLMHPWTLQTSGPGKIEVVLSSSTAVAINAETRGSISSDIPIQVQGLLTEHKLKGTLNGGGPLLKLRTSLGEIRLKKRMENRQEKGRH